MASMTIRNIGEDVKRRLRRQAAEHGRSVEAEVRDILQAAVGNETEIIQTGADLFESIRKRLAPYRDLLPLEPFPDEILPVPPETRRRKR